MGETYRDLLLEIPLVAFATVLLDALPTLLRAVPRSHCRHMRPEVSSAHHTAERRLLLLLLLLLGVVVVLLCL
jgi:hypothetical protein